MTGGDGGSGGGGGGGGDDGDGEDRPVARDLQSQRKEQQWLRRLSPGRAVAILKKCPIPRYPLLRLLITPRLSPVFVNFDFCTLYSFFFHALNVRFLP